MCIGGEPDDEKRGDAGGEHEEPPQTSERLSPHLMQYTPPGVRIGSHKYGDRVTKQEVRSAVELILEFSKNNPTAVLTEVADQLCMKFKSDFPNVQLLLRRTIQRCKEGDKSKKAAATAGEGGGLWVTAAAKINDAGDAAAAAEAHANLSAYGGGKTTRPRKSNGGGNNNKKQGGSRLKGGDKAPGGMSGVDERQSSSPSSRRRRKSKANKKENGGGGESQVPQLPRLAGAVGSRSEPLASPGPRGGGKERLASGRGGRESEMCAPGKNIRQWMLSKQMKEKEREKMKKRVLEKEMKWIEKMAMKQQDRNKANRRLEEMEEAAVVIQGSFRTHKARKVTNAMKEEKARRDMEKATLPPSLEDDSHRLFDD